jgi:thiol-disulfide isomerase/thioredoxin
VTLLIALLVGCGAPSTPPPPPPAEPVAEPTAEPSPIKRGLTADELMAMDEDDGYSAATGVLENIEESLAPPEPTPDAPKAATAKVRGQPTPRRTPRPTPTPRPYSFRGWEEGVEGFEDVAREHDSRQKSVIVYFHTDWCGWCRRLERDYFDHPRFSRWLGRMPRVHINPEDGEGERAIASMFKVRGYPTFVVMPGGTTWYSRLHPFGREGKHQTVDEFLDDAREAAEKK